jgi:hypothetical protein
MPLRSRRASARLRTLGILVLAPFAAAPALAGASLPTVPGADVTVYATVPDPGVLSFSLAGDLYVGRDASGSGGGNGDPVKIHRVGPGGAPVVEYGEAAIDDPDGVLFDEVGTVSGEAGSVLVAGQAFGVAQGRISAIRPDEGVDELVPPTATCENPGNMAFVQFDHVVVGDASGQAICQLTGGSLTIFADTAPAAPVDLEVSGSTNLVYARFTDGTVRVFGTDGSVFDPAFATGLGANGALALSSGEWGADAAYVLDGAGQLLRLDSSGAAPVVVGTGFAAGITDLEFGPGNALYVSDFNNDRVLRIALLGLDAFLCYKAKPTKGGPPLELPTVALEDELGATSARVVKPRALCNPADRAGGGISDPESHLASFGIQPDPKPPKLAGIGIENALGTLTLDATKLDRLLVPAAKSLAKPVPPLESTQVGHFACYKAKVSKGTPKLPKGTQVSVADQFAKGARTFDVKKPTRVCLATDKNGEGTPRPDDALVCYKAKPAKGQPKHAKRIGVHVNHQLGAAQLDTVKEEELCLPSSVSTTS